MEVKLLNKTDYTQIIRNKMGEYRFNHSINVAKAAVELANKYGADTAKAEIAGILHDCCKEIDKDEMLQIIRNSGIILDVAEENSPKLWHSIAGSCFARDVLKIDDEDIINAIRYHTTGRENMSLLEKIIFTADFISEERTYDDVEIMRKKAFEDLDDAMLYALQFTISSLVSRSLIVHHNTVKCYNDVLNRININNRGKV